jgi:uncharacterized protein (DUF1330 family)
MVAYVIVDIDVTDAQGFEEYKQLAQLAVAAFGGRYLARGGKTESLEGGWNPKRLVILEFESLVRARQWYESPEYLAARESRRAAATFHMLVTEGV